MWKRKRAKRKIFNNLTVLPIIFALLLIFLLLLIVKVGLFNIKRVEVQADQLSCTDTSKLSDSTGLYGQNYFLIDSVKTADKLKKKFFCLKAINLTKQFPNKIILQAFARQPFALLVDLKEKPASASSLLENIATPSAWQVKDSYIIDKEGVAFSKDQGDPGVLKIYVFDSEMSLGNNLLSSLAANPLEILEKAQTLGVIVKESWISDDSLIINQNPPSPKIIFRLDNNVNIELASLQLILDKAKIDLKEPEFIDLRFDRPIVRFAPKRDNGKR